MNRDHRLRETDLHSVPLRMSAKPRTDADNARKRNALLLGLAADSSVEDGGLSRGAVKFVAAMSCWAVALLLMYVYMQVHCTNMGYKTEALSKKVNALSLDCAELNARLTATETWDALEPKALDMGLVVDLGEVAYVRVPARTAQPRTEEVIVEEDSDLDTGLLQRLTQRFRGIPRDKQGAS